MEAWVHKELTINRTAMRGLAVAVFVIFTALGAFVRIPLPFTPVPITLQTFFVLLSAAFLGNLGALSQLIYIALGVCGLPIFSNAGSGLAYLEGPTGGYILGFVVAALFLSRMVGYANDNFFSVLMVFCLADLIIFSCGLLWLKVILGYQLKKILFIGFLPFLPGDLFKVFLAAVLYLKLKPRFQEIL